jgi:outer membrane protein
MKKNLSLILNVVLLVAVGILYYLHFTCSSDCEKTSEASGGDSTTAVIPQVRLPKEIKESRVVYINVDEMNEKYDFIKDFSASALSKQARLENAYGSKLQKFQEDYADLQEKASQGLLSENQANAAQEDMMKRRDELDQMKMQLQGLMEEVEKNNVQAHKDVVQYLKEYNKNSQYNYILTYTDGPGGMVLVANDSLDITDEVLEGLNAQYNATKASKKK